MTRDFRRPESVVAEHGGRQARWTLAGTCRQSVEAEATGAPRERPLGDPAALAQFKADDGDPFLVRAVARADAGLRLAADLAGIERRVQPFGDNN